MANTQKTAIVTGGSQGIGAGLVKAFLDRGYNVVANSRNITKSGAFEASDKLALVDGSIAEAETAAKIGEVAKSRFGSIDALVNNAGIYFSKNFTDYTVEDLRSLVSVNIEGFLFISQLAIKQMLAQKTGGSVVNITAAYVNHPIAGIVKNVPMDVLKTMQPMGQVSSVKDIVDAIIYLTEADQVTGEVLHVDGGAHVGKW